MATLILLVGLPAAGKTTTARRLAAERAAPRLTPDEWMIPLFDDNDANGKRDVLEGRLITVALELVRLGTGVVLDFGCWSRAERSALRRLTEDAGGTFELVYLPVDRATQLARIDNRWRTAPHETFPMTVADVDRWRTRFETPDADELAGTLQQPPPQPWPTWRAWARHRWPSLTTGDVSE